MILPKDRQELIRNQVELFMARQREIDHLWDDQVDVRYSSLLFIFYHLLIIAPRTRIRALYPPTVRISSNIFLPRTHPLQDRTTRTMVILPQLALSACATAGWVEGFLIVVMPNLSVLHLGYRGRHCLPLKKKTTLWMSMSIKRKSR